MSFNLMLPPILGVVGLVIAFVIYTVMSRASDGNEKERGIAQQIHIGAMVFMHREYKLLLAFAAVLIVGILVSPLGTNTAIAFVAGAVSSATAGYLGMYAATKANVRTAVAANTEGAASALNIAFYGGSIMGLCVASLGLLGLGGLYYYFGGDPHTAHAIHGFGMGGSVVALFSRVGGGIYTKSVAVDALGPERVEAAMMPFRYTASMSVEDAEAEAKALGVRFNNLSIEPLYEAFMTALADEFEGLAPNITEENLQARCRGVLLMSISNKKNLLVLTTGNKSELAVGYSTLYGDMAGGFDVLKDCPKMLVYALARYRNTLGDCIPERVITRPPSAELAPDQKDEDSLPPYEVLDQIIEMYVEQDASRQEMVAAGFSHEDVERVVRLVDLNEYKRRQAPVGVRISRRAFGRDRRYPITWAWRSSS